MEGCHISPWSRLFAILDNKFITVPLKKLVEKLEKYPGRAVAYAREMNFILTSQWFENYKIQDLREFMTAICEIQ